MPSPCYPIILHVNKKLSQVLIRLQSNYLTWTAAPDKFVWLDKFESTLGHSKTHPHPYLLLEQHFRNWMFELSYGRGFIERFQLYLYDHEFISKHPSIIYLTSQSTAFNTQIMYYQ